MGKKGSKVPDGGWHRERMLHIRLPCPFPGLPEVRASPKCCCKGPPRAPPQVRGLQSYLSAHTALTRLPAALAAPLVGGNLILGGPSLLQALWAVAVPIGICIQER